jgi:hypothetical protein
VQRHAELRADLGCHAWVGASAEDRDFPHRAKAKAQDT